MVEDEPQSQYIACPGCGKDFPWNTYFAGKLLCCDGCDGKFLSASADAGQAFMLPPDAAPRSTVTMAALASMAEAEEEFYDPRRELPEGVDERLYELTVLSSARAQSTCRFCQAAVMAGAAACGRCGRNPVTGEMIDEPQAAWSAPRKRDGMFGRFFRKMRIGRRRRRRRRSQQ